MAPGTVDRHAAGRRHHLSHHVVQVIRAGQPLEDGTGRLRLPHEIPRPRREETGGDHRLGIVGSQRVTGNLVAQKLVIRHVGVQRLDDPVAIAPGVVAPLIAFESVRVGVMSDVQPVPRPPLAVMRRIEQPFDEAFIRIWITIVDERLDLFRRRGETEQIKRQPPNQRPPVRLRRRNQFVRFEPRENKLIDLVARPPLVLDRWHGRSFHRLKGPP